MLPIGFNFVKRREEIKRNYIIEKEKFEKEDRQVARDYINNLGLLEKTLAELCISNESSKYHAAKDLLSKYKKRKIIYGMR